MTASDKQSYARAPITGVSTSSPPMPLFGPDELLDDFRVKQADFARMCGVSRQTVSVWVRSNKISSIYPDGTFSPRQAAREVIKNTDPARLRAKIFRIAAEDTAALRCRVAVLEREISLQEARYKELATAYDLFRSLLLARKAWICADAGERYESEIAGTEEEVWFLALNPDAIDDFVEDDCGDLPLFDQDTQTPETAGTDEEAWFLALNPDALDDFVEDDCGDPPLFDQDTQTQETAR